jgi:hypothetical protein
MHVGTTTVADCAVPLVKIWPEKTDEAIVEMEINLEKNCLLVLIPATSSL